MTKAKTKQPATDPKPTRTLVLVVKPPAHLSPDATAFWNEVVMSYELEGHHLRLLQACAESWDRMQEARKVIAREGMTVPTNAGVKAHPAIAIERDAKQSFSRLLRELDLDFVPGGSSDAKRPPALKSNR
jgi:phage terminase small subunit